jgi:AraC-like DNA-binding protein
MHTVASSYVDRHRDSPATVRLERISRCGRGDCPGAAERSRHPPRQQLPRHLHRRAFAAVVISGGYVEAGDTGRHWMEPGDVLLHQAWESHLDTIDGRGAEVLMLDLEEEVGPNVVGRIADPEALVQLAERDQRVALAHLLATLVTKPQRQGDWPDLLALALCREPTLCLHAWADAHGLHPGSISRGFRQVFGLTPAAYRLAQRTGHAVRAIRSSGESLSHIAQDCGFADQAHMNRSVRRLAGATPVTLREPHATRKRAAQALRSSGGAP